MLITALAPPGTIIIHRSARFAERTALDGALGLPTGSVAAVGVFLARLLRLKSRQTQFRSGDRGDGRGDIAPFIFSESGVVLHCALQHLIKQADSYRA